MNISGTSKKAKLGYTTIKVVLFCSIPFLVLLYYFNYEVEFKSGYKNSEFMRLINVERHRNTPIELIRSNANRDFELPNDGTKLIFDNLFNKFDKELLHVNLPFNLYSHPILIYPKGSAPSCIFLYHAGHGSQFDGLKKGQSIPLIDGALQIGCLVGLFEMPRGGRGMTQVNRNQPILKRADGTTKDLTDFTLHDGFRDLSQEEQVHAISLFIQPVIDVIDMLEVEFPGLPIVMAGLSGGGWTTSMAAAVDTRISISINIAGADPEESAAYDFEQSHPVILKYGYENIFALAGSGRSRKHVHVYNEFDSCCFKARDVQLRNRQEIKVNNLISGIGPLGSYKLIIDSSGFGHAVHPHSLEFVLGVLRDVSAEFD